MSPAEHCVVLSVMVILVGQWSLCTVLLRILHRQWIFSAYIVYCPTNRVLPPAAQHDGQNLCRMCTVADLEEGRALSVLNRKRSIESI